MKMKIIVVTLAVITVLSFCVAFGATFSDVAGTKYEDAVSKLVSNGIVNGFEDNTYRPKDNVTRAQLTKMLVEMLKLQTTGKNEKTFSDVSSNHWAYNYIKRATDNSIINGYEDGTFKPDKEVSFVEAAAMMLRRMDLDNELKGLEWPDGYILLAMDKGLYRDVEIGGLDFSVPANRGEVAIMLYNFIKINDEKNQIKEQTGKDNKEETIKLDLTKSWSGKYINIVDGYMELELEQDGNTLNYSFMGYKYGSVKAAKSTAELNGNVATDIRDIFDDHLKLTLTRTEDGILVTTEGNKKSYELLNGLYKIDNGGLNTITYTNPNRLDANYKLGNATITLSENPNGTMSFSYEYNSSNKFVSASELLNYENNIASIEKPGFFDDDEPSKITVKIESNQIVVSAYAPEDSFDSKFNEMNGTYKLDSKNTNAPTITEMKNKIKGYSVGDGVYMGF